MSYTGKGTRSLTAFGETECESPIMGTLFSLPLTFPEMNQVHTQLLLGGQWEVVDQNKAWQYEVYNYVPSNVFAVIKNKTSIL